jgi:hypothetical protein
VADLVVVGPKYRALVAGDYAGLARDGFVEGAEGPDDDSSGMWIEDYPYRLIPFPEGAWPGTEYDTAPDNPKEYRVTIALWTAEEGASDLTLEAALVEHADRIAISIDNVHVM